MDVTIATWAVAITGLVLIGLLGALQLAAVVRPRAAWTVRTVYGGDPDATDPTAYFAFNQGLAWADVLLWVPLQVAGSIGMLLGQEWGFLLALAASAPYVYTAIPIFVWDRDLGFRGSGFSYWVVIWGMWPAFGIVQGVYLFARLLG
jgi:hypothetical protein